MLVALMIEGKFSGEGLHSIEADEDMLAAMARELVEKGGVGESGRRGLAVAAGKTNRASPPSGMPDAGVLEALAEPDAEVDGLCASSPFPAPGPVLVHSEPKKKTLWPTGLVAGDQLKLFG